MHKKLIALFLCMVFILGITVGTVGAAAANEEIVAILNRVVKIKLNGSDYIPLDEDGTQMYPITYKGRTYLPARSIAKVLSIAVNYDPINQIIHLGERGLVPLEGEAYVNNHTSQLSTDTTLLQVNKQQYKWGIIYTGTAGYYEYSGFIYPKGNYQKFGGVACMEDLDGSTEEVIIKIRENDFEGKVLKEIVVKKGESIPFEIDIPGVNTLYIQNLVTDRVPKNTNPDIMMISEPYFK
ncbi:MAG: hypothetical protein CVU84_16385 [Firmicutes bacterium HGW-Firmicutes-1]|jgi:hypothetical protein|nr:MAG: hypothetical protein CVU84_16385 [Firmicutes bacterium HGW-Firmicutes-1]